MRLLTSSRERKFWLLSIVVIAAIFSTLFIGRPLADLFGNQDIQALIFLTGMILVGIAILLHGIKTRPSRFEYVVWFGIIAVYLMLILRLGLPERSHLIEYSVLSIFIHKALLERSTFLNKIFKPAMLAMIISFLIGIIDECLQIFLPHRVFDPVDILFNGFVIIVAIGFHLIIRWLQSRRIHSQL